MHPQSTSKKNLVIALAFSLIAATLGLNAYRAPQAEAQTLGDPFVCDGTFHFMARFGGAANPSLYTIDTSTNPFGLNLIGDTGQLLGGSGYNPLDNFIYSLEHNTGELFRIGSDGIAVSTGRTLLALVNAASIDSNGQLVIRQTGNGTPLLTYDLTDPAIPLVSTVPTTFSAISDMAHHPTTGDLYTVRDGGILSQIDQTTGAETVVALTGDALPGSPYGGQFFDAQGRFFAYSNNGQFYRIELDNTGTAGTSTLVSLAAATNANDAASCPGALPTAVAGVAKNMTVAGNGPWNVTITYTSENLGDDILSELSMTDDLQAVFGTPGTDWELLSASASGPAANFAVNPNFDGETGGDTELFEDGSELLPDATGTIDVVIQLNTPGNYENAVTLDGISKLTGDAATDDSVAGTNPDPDDNDDPNESGPATISLSALDVTKTAGDPAIAASGTEGNVDVEFTITVTNEGDEPVDEIQVTDDLDDQFGTAFVDVVSGPTVTGGLTATRANSAFNGDTNVDLLTTDAGESLAASESFTVTFTVEIDPDAAISSLPIENVATAIATPPTGPPIVTPNPPTTVLVSQLEHEKILITAIPSVATPGATDIEYTITVSNTGTEDISGLTLTDDLDFHFGTALIGVSDGPTITGDLTPARANAAYDGVADINLITTDPAETISAGESFAVTFTITVNPNAAGAPDPLENSSNPDGTPPPVGPPIILPPEPPTPLVATSLRTEKTVSSQTDAASGVDGNVDATFVVTVTNNGTEDIDDLQVTDDLADQFGAAFIEVVSPPVVTGLLTPGRASIAYDGDGDINLLTANVTEAIAPGETFTITFTAEIDPDANPAALPLENVANGTGGSQGPFPTPPAPVEVPSLFPAKDIVEQANAASGTPGNFDVTYRITVLNNGTEPATGIELVDDVTTQLGTAFVAITSAPVVTNVDAAVPPTGNAAYDGFGDLLDGSVVQVEAAQSFFVDFTVEIDPNAAGAPGELGNTATVTGTTATGLIPPRVSVVGLDPDVGPPGPVVLDVPRIRGVETVDVANNGYGTYSVAFAAEAVNTGATRLDDVGLDLDLAETFSGVESWTIEAVTSDDFVVSSTYDGETDIDLLAPNANSLEVGERGTVAILVTLIPASGDTVRLPDDGAYFRVGLYVTQFLASGYSPEGVLVTDLSGVTLDDDLPLEFELIEEVNVTTAKEAVSATVDDDGLVAITYRVHAENGGNVAVGDLQITDDLTGTFAGFPFEVTDVNSPDFAVNAAFEGDTDINLLAGTDTITIGATGWVEFTVLVDASSAADTEVTFENTAHISGRTPIGEPTRVPTSPGSSPVAPSGDSGTPTAVTVDIPGSSEPPPALALTGVEVSNGVVLAVLLIVIGVLFLMLGRSEERKLVR